VTDAPEAPYVGRNYIDGEMTPAPAGDSYATTNPMRPTETLGEFAASTEVDAAAAVTAAENAFGGWAGLSTARRAAYFTRAAAALDARSEQVAQDMTNEMGKPLREARGEVGRAAEILRFAASQAFGAVGEHYEQSASGAQVSTLRRPVGVVGLIAPWNFPLAIPTWKLAPALIYGNTVVLKLAYDSPRTGLHLAEAFAEAELPPGVLNVLTGRGSSVGAALVQDERVRAISFTGSVATGHSVRDQAIKAGKRVQLELGGQNPLIVMADADLDRAVEAAYAGAFWSAGQKCTATRRIYVQDAAYETFRERLLARVARGKVGDPSDPSVEVGPLVNQAQFDEVLDAIERGKREGGNVIAGGASASDTGFVIEPTIFESVSDDAFLSCEEVFGPVTSLYRFTDLDDAMRRANAGIHGLAAAIFTSDLGAATRFQREAQAGLIHVNSQTAGAEVHVPFGGVKASGFGPHEQGRAAIEFFTDTVTVYVDP
jgi:acyl-CoA reductase-like NAD-dependent aldehyde dehydrogenase